MIKATKHQGLAGYRFLIALAAISLFPAGRADCFAGVPSATASNSASTVIQTKKLTVTGTVVDSKGEPLVGVSVIEKGTMNGVITDSKGHFSISVEYGATLSVSSI